MIKRVLLQTGFWLLFFIFWYQIVYTYVGSRGNRLLFTFFDVSLIAVTFYFVYLFAVPQLLLKKKRVLFLFSLLGIITATSFVLIGLLKAALHSNFFQISFSMSWNYSDLYNNRFFIALFGAVAGLAAKLSLEWAQSSKRIRQIELEKTRAELDYLRSQVNPHFLFNALNTIYFQLDESTDNARSSLLKFADILRYQLYDCNDELVPVIKEIEYLDNYIKIQKLRKGTDFKIDFSFDTIWNDGKVAPLLLIPFVENAFKHVSAFTDRENSISIALEKKDEFLQFTCTNTFDKADSVNHGLGIANVKRRLELIYPGKHALTINSRENVFDVHLKIDL